MLTIVMQAPGCPLEVLFGAEFKQLVRLIEVLFSGLSLGQGIEPCELCLRCCGRSRPGSHQSPDVTVLSGLRKLATGMASSLLHGDLTSRCDGFEALDDEQGSSVDAWTLCGCDFLRSVGITGGPMQCAFTSEARFARKPVCT